MQKICTSHDCGHDRVAPADHVLSQILQKSAENCLTPEEKERILAPIRERIYAGEFSDPPGLRRFWKRLPRIRALIKSRLSPLKCLALAGAAAVVLAAALVRVPRGGRFSVLPDIKVPLAAAPCAESSLSGSVVLNDRGVGGVGITLVDAGSMRFIDTVITQPDGSYAFSGLPDGIYKMKITLPPGMAGGESIGEWAAVDGNSDFPAGKDGDGAWTPINIRLDKPGP